MVAIHDSVIQGVAIAVGGVLFAGVVTATFRRTMISFRYWFGWLAVALVLIVAGVVLAVLPNDAEVFGLRPLQQGAVLFLLVNLLIAVQLSVSLSGHEKMITTLAQDNAELRRRVELLERHTTDVTSPQASPATPSGTTSPRRSPPPPPAE